MVVKINHLLTPSPPPPKIKKNKMIEFLYCKKYIVGKKVIIQEQVHSNDVSVFCLAFQIFKIQRLKIS